MVTTKESTIREHVIALLRADGYSPIHSTELWDQVYSGQYESAKPGAKVTWVIGEYHFEFTKQARETVQAQEAVPQASSKLLAWVIFFALLTIATAAYLYLS